MTYKLVLRFGWALFWLYFGAILAVANGFYGFAVGIGAILGLVFGDCLSMTVKRIISVLGKN